MLKWALFLSLLSFSAASFGEESQSSYATEVLGACKAEVKDHCHDKNLKQGEVTACLKLKSQDEKNKFTSGCKDTLAKKK